MTSLRHLATDKLFVEGWVIHRIYDMPTEYLILKNKKIRIFFFHQLHLSAIFRCMGIKGGIKGEEGTQIIKEQKVSAFLPLVKYPSYPDFSTGFLCIKQLFRLLHCERKKQ